MPRITHFPTPLIIVAAMTLACSLPSNAKAQRVLSARQAYNTVPVQFGPQAAQWIAEIQGINGIPQPSEWHILAYDPQAPQLLRRFWSAEGRAGDNGPDLERYPRNVPVGYFNINQLGVDSVAAFTIAEGEARKAKMGFDSCSYLLRVREYSSEPIWRLELIDVNRRTVGKVYVSGQNGEVLRTVWIDYNNSGKITDSSAPGNRPAPAQPGVSSTGQPSTNQPGVVTGNYNGPPPVTGQGGANSTGTTGTMRPFSPVPPSGTLPPQASPKTDPVATTRPPAQGSTTTNTIPDLRNMPKKPVPKPDASKPPVPTSSGSGSGRIPPPPIPPSQ